MAGEVIARVVALAAHVSRAGFSTKSMAASKRRILAMEGSAIFFSKRSNQLTNSQDFTTTCFSELSRGNGAFTFGDVLEKIQIHGYPSGD
jgi:hypothetical protein